MKKLLPAFVLFWLLLLTVYVIWVNFSQSTYAYVNVARAFNEFTYTKELKADISSIQKRRMSTLDSLERLGGISYDSVSVAKDEKRKAFFMLKYQELRQEYIERKQYFDASNEQMTVDYDAKILKQLNQYVSDYGEGHNYTIVFGSLGDGGIMYGEKSTDITSEVIEYINTRYSGFGNEK